MRTPKEYTNYLKEHVITNEMLASCLFSVNKRAKNCRDQERAYRSKGYGNRYWYDKYDTEESYQQKKQEYYSMKELLLSVIQPKEIHVEFLGYEKVRVYDYEPGYKECSERFVYANRYWDEEFEKYVYFGDYYNETSPKYHYYLFYELGEYSFHTPIEKSDLEKYSNLNNKKIDQLHTKGKEINDLISVQFVKKVIELISSGEYKLQFCKTEEM